MTLGPEAVNPIRLSSVEWPRLVPILLMLGEHRSRSTRSLLVQSCADSGESTHPMHVLWVFGQILPVRFKLGVGVSDMKEAHVPPSRRRFQAACLPANASSMKAAAEIIRVLDFLIAIVFLSFSSVIRRERPTSEESSSWDTSS